jgi:hypothetical protein
MLAAMGDILKLVWWAVTGLFRSRASLEAEILTLRQQLNVLQRKAPKGSLSALSTIWCLPVSIGLHQAL